MKQGQDKPKPAEDKGRSKFMDDVKEDLHQSLMEDDMEGQLRKNDTLGISEIITEAWKPARFHSYETMALADSQLNCKIRPCGFRSNGKMRKIKNNCLIAKIKTKCRLRGKNPKMAVCITMYNEDEQELRNTLTGVLHNYNELRVDKELNFKKEDFIVFLICDGYNNIPASFKKFATEKSFFDLDVLEQKGFMEKDRDGKLRMKDMRDIMDSGVKAPLNVVHMFQVQSWDFGMQDDMLKSRRINFVFAIKQRNDGKINSHRWFFQGLCKYLKPDLCLMLDIGTRPDKHAVFKLYKYMDRHNNCGGCCGEIEVDFSQDKGISASYFVKAAQFFEYKMGHSPDKACESFFGFNSVLPGAYSIFRWKAIKGQPLDEFFRSVTREDFPSCAEANEFLAEDRVMCLQIYIKKNCKYHLSYIPDCKAFTDAPDSLAVLIKQRRRWMNGAMFGTVKVISNFLHMVSCKRTTHSWYRQIGIVFFLTYYTLTFLFQFLTVGSMYASITIFLKQTFGKMLEVGGYNATLTLIVESFFDYLYLSMVVMALVISLTTTVDRGVAIFQFLMCIFGFLLIFTMSGIIFFLSSTGLFAQQMAYNNQQWVPQYYADGTPVKHFSYLVLSGIIMMVVFLIPMILRPLDFLGNTRNYILGLMSYLFMMPTFINIMQIYAMCNLHDISWGNRPSTQGIEAVTHNAVAQEILKQDYQVFRAYFLFFWLIANFIFGGLMVFITGGSNTMVVNDGTMGFLDGFSLFISGIIVFKFIFALFYTLKWNFRTWCKPYYRKSKTDVNEEFKRIRKDRNGAVSSDEEEPEEEQSKKTGDLDAMKSYNVFDQDGEGNPVMKDAKNAGEIDDSDNDDEEFEDAKAEEEGDKELEDDWRQKSVQYKYSQQTQMRRFSRNQNPAMIESIVSIDHDNPNMSRYNAKMGKNTAHRNSKDTSIGREGALDRQKSGQIKNAGILQTQNNVKFSVSQAFGESDAVKAKSVRFLGVPASVSSGGDSQNQNVLPANLKDNKKQQIAQAAKEEINVLKTSVNKSRELDDESF